MAIAIVLAADFVGIDARDLALQIGVAFVLAFLIILILRYVILLWLGYLHHVEAETLPDEIGETPPVTIVVPAH
jgi:hypothetical protein